MSDDTQQLREQLSAEWQKTALDLITTGIPAQSVFETLMTVGIAGHSEVQGKRATARALLAIAQRLAAQLQEEAEAMIEAEDATKN
jgi:hypothetical protein